MATTPKLNFSYPLPSDGPAGPQQMQALAESIEAVVAARFAQSGTVSGSFSALDAPVTLSVTYPRPYAAAVFPSVTLTGWGGGVGISFSVTAWTASGFTLTTRKTQGALGAVTFFWNVTGQI